MGFILHSLNNKESRSSSTVALDYTSYFQHPFNTFLIIFFSKGGIFRSSKLSQIEVNDF